MREVARIERILDRLRLIWGMAPDQRFGQLLDNYVFGYQEASHLFFVEDDVIEQRMDNYIGKLSHNGVEKTLRYMIRTYMDSLDGMEKKKFKHKMEGVLHEM